MLTRILLVLTTAVVLFGCQSNEDKITQFCAAWKASVEQHQGDCAKMGDALKATFEEHKNTKLYGSIDNEKLASVKKDCDDATAAMKDCVDVPEMKEALKALQRKK